MAWGFRAGTGASKTGNSTGFPLAQALGAAVSAGDRIIVGTVIYKTNATDPATAVVTDNLNAGNYTEDAFVTYNDNGFHQRMSLYSMANSAAGTPTVTVASSNVDGGGMALGGWSGLATSGAATDQTASGAGVGGTAASSATATTAAANELVVGLYTDDGWSTSAITTAAGWTSRASVPSSAVAELNIADQDSGSSGATPAFSLAAGNPGGSTITWGMLTAVYTLPAGGAPPAPAIPYVIAPNYRPGGWAGGWRR